MTEATSLSFVPLPPLLSLHLLCQTLPPPEMASKRRQPPARRAKPAVKVRRSATSGEGRSTVVTPSGVVIRAIVKKCKGKVYFLIHLRGTRDCRCGNPKIDFCRAWAGAGASLTCCATGKHKYLSPGHLVGAHVVLAMKLPGGGYKVLWKYGTFLIPTCHGHNVDYERCKEGFKLPLNKNLAQFLTPFSHCACGFAPSQAHFGPPAPGCTHPSVKNDPGF